MIHIICIYIYIINIIYISSPGRIIPRPALALSKVYASGFQGVASNAGTSQGETNRCHPCWLMIYRHLRRVLLYLSKNRDINVSDKVWLFDDYGGYTFQYAGEFHDP